MTQTIGRGGVTHDELALLHDGELSGAQAHELQAQVEGDLEVRAELERMALMQRLVVASLEQRAAEVPQARFEQIWEEVDRAIDRDARLKEAAERKASIWTRLRTMARPLRLPALATAAAALAIWWVVGPEGGLPESALPHDNAVASLDEPQEAPAKLEEASAPPAIIAERTAATSPQPAGEIPFSDPKPVEAEIHEVEFGGRAGRIGHVGTVTVLYVEEDTVPTDNERSL